VGAPQSTDGDSRDPSAAEWIFKPDAGPGRARLGDACRSTKRCAQIETATGRKPGKKRDPRPGKKHGLTLLPMAFANSRPCWLFGSTRAPACTVIGRPARARADGC
jgi:hypothetical protein